MGRAAGVGAAAARRRHVSRPPGAPAGRHEADGQKRQPAAVHLTWRASDTVLISPQTGVPGFDVPQALADRQRLRGRVDRGDLEGEPVSSLAETAPFIGESTRNVCRTTVCSGPFQS